MMKKLNEQEKDILIISLICGIVVLSALVITLNYDLDQMIKATMKLIKTIYLGYDCSYVIEQRNNSTNTQVWNNFLDDILKQKGCMK